MPIFYGAKFLHGEANPSLPAGWEITQRQGHFVIALSPDKKEHYCLENGKVVPLVGGKVDMDKTFDPFAKTNPEHETSNAPALDREFETNITRCARCGGNHIKVTFKRFTLAPPNASHFALCPDNGEPIICMAGVQGDVVETNPQPGGKKKVLIVPPKKREGGVILPGG